MTERFTPGPVDVYTSYEHWHRYLWVLSRAKDRTVLDLACGSGYGSWLLSRVARSVRGVDRDEAAIEEAKTRFVRENLAYEVGDAESYQGDPVDLIVSFETIEHLENPEKLLDVIRRNLLPDGIALISTPNRKTYSEETGYANPYHTREFDIQEFLALLATHFPTVIPYGQRLVTGSLISSIEGERFRRGTVAVEPVTFDTDGGLESTAGSGPAPTYQLVEVSLEAGKVLPRSGSVLLDRDSLLWTQMAQGSAGSASLSTELQKQIENLLVVQGQIISLEAAIHSMQAQQTSTGAVALELQKQIGVSIALQSRLASLEGSVQALREHQLGGIHEELQRRIESSGEQQNELTDLRSEVRRLTASSAAVAEELQKQIDARMHLETEIAAVAEELQKQSGERPRLETEIAAARRIAAGSEKASTALENRLQILENARPPRPSVDLSSQPASERAERLVHALQGMIEDVAADNRDLHKQVDLLVSHVEGRPGQEARNAAPGQDAPRRAARLALRAARRLPAPVRGVLARGRNALTRGFRVGAREDAAAFPAGAARIELAAVDRPPLPAPLLSVVVEPGDTAFREIARRQTMVEREWLLWDPASGSLRIEREDGAVVREEIARDAAAVRSAASGIFLVRLDESIARAPLSWWETATFAMAAEGLSFFRTPAVERDASEPPAPPFLMVRRELWSHAQGVDAESLRSAIQGGKNLVVGKEAAGTFAGSPLAPALDLPALPDFLRRLDFYWIAAAAAPSGPVRHEIAALDRLLSGIRSPDPRPSVLFLLPDLPGSRVEDELRPLLAESPGLRLLVVSCSPVTSPLQKTLDRFRELTPYVYSLGDALPRELFFSAVSHILRSYDVAAFLHAGESSWLALAVRHIRQEFPAVRIVAAPPDEPGNEPHDLLETADLVLARNPRQREELTRSGVAAARLRPLPRGLPSAARLGCREADDSRTQTVVAWIGDLVPGQRPEDFLAIARRFRGDDGFLFRLIGEGPLAADVDVLIDNMGLTNVRREGRESTPESVLATSDVLCATAEHIALPGVVLQALASGIPVVSPALSDLGQGAPGLAAGVPSVAAGNVTGFEAALRSLATPDRRRAAAAQFGDLLASLPSAAMAGRELAGLLIGDGPDSGRTP